MNPRDDDRLKLSWSTLFSRKGGVDETTRLWEDWDVLTRSAALDTDVLHNKERPVLLLPVPGVPVLSASGSKFETLDGENLGGQIGVGSPGIGLSTTRTVTRTFSFKRSATELFCRIDPNCL